MSDDGLRAYGFSLVAKLLHISESYRDWSANDRVNAQSVLDQAANESESIDGLSAQDAIDLSGWLDYVDRLLK